MRGTNRGLFLLFAVLALWAVGGHAFYRIDRWHDEQGFHFLTNLIAHKSALAEATPSPRVVIAGGSNAYYAIDAHILQQRLGIPVVNVALPFGAHHYSISLALLEKLVRPGDVVVYASARFWPAADDEWRRARGFDSYLIQSGIPNYTRQFEDNGIPWLALPRTNSLLLAITDSLTPRKGRPWVAETDDRGGYMGCVPAPVLFPEDYGSGELNAGLADAVRAAAARLKAQGARLLVHLPWLFIDEDERDRWATFRTRFVSRYEHFVPVIAADPHAVLRSDRSDFCDSPMHLSIGATRQRSESLAAALRPYLWDVHASRTALPAARR